MDQAKATEDLDFSRVRRGFLTRKRYESTTKSKGMSTVLPRVQEVLDNRNWISKCMRHTEFEPQLMWNSRDIFMSREIDLEHSLLRNTCFWLYLYFYHYKLYRY
jgi:hypothetical protein